MDDPEMGGSCFGPNKRRKEASLFDNSIGYWRVIDAGQFRREGIDFLKLQRRNKQLSDSSYSVEGHQGSHHLQQLHKEGRLKVPPN